MSLRRRIEKSKWLSGTIGGLLSRYLALCNRTTDWQIEGLDDMKDALSEGPILLMMWHSRMAMGAPHWPSDHAPVTSLHHRSPLGRISGVMQRYEGLTPFEMSATRSNLVASRAVMKRFHQGISIVMTGDGPVGPAHKLQDAPLDWARRSLLMRFPPRAGIGLTVGTGCFCPIQMAEARKSLHALMHQSHAS